MCGDIYTTDLRIIYLVWLKYFHNVKLQITGSLCNDIIFPNLVMNSQTKLWWWSIDLNIYGECWMHWKDNQALIFSFCLCFINKINLAEDNRNVSTINIDCDIVGLLYNSWFSISIKIGGVHKLSLQLGVGGLSAKYKWM